MHKDTQRLLFKTSSLSAYGLLEESRCEMHPFLIFPGTIKNLKSGIHFPTRSYIFHPPETPPMDGMPKKHEMEP